MSGIEVAGIALATFPLLISALEHWRDTYKAADLLVHFQIEHKKCVDEVKDERFKFSLLLEILLQPLVPDGQLEQTDLETLLDSNDFTGWVHTDAEKALRSRLRTAYERFMVLLEELQAALWETLASLGPRVHEKLSAAKRDKDSVTCGQLYWKAHAKYLAAAATSYRSQQLRFSIDRDGRKARLQELRDVNAKLRDLLDLCDKVGRLNLTSRSTVSSRASKALLEYWTHADCIYHLLQAAWKCSCKDAHCALLWLHHPTNGYRISELRLLILWCAKGVRLNQVMPSWEQQGLEITRLKGRNLDQRLALLSSTKAQSAPGGPQPVSAAVQSNTVSRPASSPSPGPPPAKRARIASGPALHNVAQATTPLVTIQPRANHTIDDLCKDLNVCALTPAYIGSLSDPYAVLLDPTQRVGANEISLQQMLQDPGGCAIKRAHRIQIALDVASTHLRLQSTSWTRAQLQSQHVLFPKGAQDDIIVDRPYISASFDAKSPMGAQNGHLVSGPSFACLGILLMELWFGVAFEDHELWQQAGFEQHKSNPAIRGVVAIMWANSVGDDAGPELAAAVKWCLQGSPSSLTGEQWRKDLAEKVVLRLQNCRDWMQKGHAISRPAQP